MGTGYINMRLSFSIRQSFLQLLLDKSSRTKHANVVLTLVAHQYFVKVAETYWAKIPEDFPFRDFSRPIIYALIKNLNNQLGRK